MQFDKTSIVIVQRSGPDILDLSLSVVRRYWKAVCLLALLGALPFALVNLVLTYPLSQYDSLVVANRGYSYVGLFHFRYLTTMCALVYVQAPLALSPMTYYIGQAVFSEEPSLKRVFASVANRWFQLVLILGVFRFGLLGWVPVTLMFLSPIPQWEMEALVYGLMIVGWVFSVRCVRPFASEIILLERCPMRKPRASKSTFSYAQRSKWLHHPLQSDLLIMKLGLTIAGALTALAVSCGFVFIIGVLAGVWTWGLWMDLILFPLTLWGVAAWLNIVRFLSYMNSRIRTEGWELELRLKAEALRLQGATP